MFVPAASCGAFLFVPLMLKPGLWSYIQSAERDQNFCETDLLHFAQRDGPEPSQSNFIKCALTSMIQSADTENRLCPALPCCWAAQDGLRCMKLGEAVALRHAPDWPLLLFCLKQQTTYICFISLQQGQGVCEGRGVLVQVQPPQRKSINQSINVWTLLFSMNIHSVCSLCVVL